MINTAQISTFLNEVRSELKYSQIFTILGMLSTTIAVLITFCVYLGVYAFNNPDKEAWIGIVNIDANERVIFKTKGAVEAANAVQVVDIHARFVSWFLWGFINWFAPLFIVLLAVLTCSINQIFGAIAVSALSLASACSATAWFIVGAVWRFNLDGQYASGTLIPSGKTPEEWNQTIIEQGSHYQVNSGRFMKYFYMICFILVSLNCIITSLGCCVTVFCLTEKQMN